MVCLDIVLQYYSTLKAGESPKQIYVSMESVSLWVLFPLVMGKEMVECVIDGGSQIVSMALTLAERLGLSWDPDIQIFMQSANGQLKKSAGLARNVPFLFGDIAVYLQVHIIDQPAYQVLLGRPFNVLTESLIQNHKNGSQSITIRDPNTERRLTLPTHARGTFKTLKDVTRPPKIVEVPDGNQENESPESSEQKKEEADFQSSSRN